jgi:hypothetical protein
MLSDIFTSAPPPSRELLAPQLPRLGDRDATWSSAAGASGHSARIGPRGEAATVPIVVPPAHARIHT